MFSSDIVVQDVVSCDVFDTLLQRDGRSEASRQLAIAKLAARRLRDDLGIVVEEGAILHARAGAQRRAYRALDMLDPRGEVRFADLVQATAAILRLDTSGAAMLAESECAIERAQLSPNRPLLGWLGKQARAGRRVVAISDTWHSSATIAGFLDALAPGHPIATVYTSADHAATKRSMALFPLVLRAERVRPEQVLHIGDDRVADVAMARSVGLHCAPVSCPRSLRLLRKVDAALFRARQPSYRH